MKTSRIICPSLIAFRSAFALILAAVAFLSSVGFADAQQWPTRPVKVIVPYGVGGVTDTMARLTADRLTRVFGQSFYIENRPGAGGSTGTSMAVRSAADGYTLLFIGGAQFSVVPLTHRLNYDPVKDLAPISIIGTNGSVLAVSADSPIASLREFVAFARSNSGKVSYSTAGPATNTHLAAALLGGRAQLDMIHVPFNSGPAALTALLSKSVQMHFGNSSDMIEPVRSGTVKALGVSTLGPMPQLPTVPAVADTLPGFELLGWNGYFAPVGTPKDVLDSLSKELRAIAQDPEIKSKLYNLGIDATGHMPEEIRKVIARDIPLFAEIVDMAGLRLKL